MTHPESAASEHGVGGDRAAAGAVAVLSRSVAAHRAPRRREWRQQNVKDQLGSVRLVVQTVTTGEVVQKLEYGPFGEILVDTNPGFQPFGFAGGLFEFETGLVRFGARDYDPEVGRWTSKDPIGFGGGQANLYVYVGNDPVNFFDPDGTSKTKVIYKAWRAVRGGLKFGKNVTLKQVLGHLAHGEGVHVPDRSTAVRLAKQYSRMKGGTGKIKVDKAHVRDGHKGFDHVHALGPDGKRLEGHFWFGFVSTFTLILDVTGDAQFDEFDVFEWANPIPFIPLIDHTNKCVPTCA